MVVLYGIKTCDSIKKARRWLEQNGIEYRFHDYRSDGLDHMLLQSFADSLGWEALLNKSSTSWRQLSEEQKTGLDTETALALMLATPTLIKRPLLDTGAKLILGFKDYERHFRTA